jgi:DNA polymerase
VQLQNLPQNHLSDLDSARQMVKEDDWESIDVLYGNVPDTLSQLIRTTFVAKPGYTFAVADFSAIEARVIAYMADEQWRMDLFARGGDIYCQSASQMFGVPVVKHGVNGHLRQKGKIAELGCGYGGSAGALINMGALKMGLTEEELPEIVQKWREASPHIVKLWWTLGEAMIDALLYKKVSNLKHGINVWRTNKMLIMQLPSGRCLRYFDPQIGLNRFGKETVTYMGYEAGKWSRLESYGPKFVENCIQGIARDCLVESMKRVSKRYPDIVMHVHDEMIVEVPEAEAEEALKYISDCMAEPISWAPGMLLRGDGYITKYYKKD